MTMRDYWNERAEAWSTRIDIGCGPATSTLDIARRLGPTGRALGIDISSAMIEDAQRRIDAAATSDAAPIELRVGDAERVDIGTDFDGAYSRFGVMFFDDPTTAFANIATALRPGGRISWAIWGALDRNPWAVVPTAATAEVLGASTAEWSPDGPGPFAYGDLEQLDLTLRDAGFNQIKIENFAQPRLLTNDTAANDLKLWLAVGPLGHTLTDADDDLCGRAIDAGLEAMNAYRTPEGWAIPALAHVVSAVKR